MPEESHRHGGAGGSPECQICPVCVLLQALSTSRPEVTAHLLGAARELSLALRAALDVHGEASDRPDERLRRINID